MSGIRNAIHNSIKTGQIVTMTINSESDLQEAFGELLDTVPQGHLSDHVLRTPTFLEVWGSTGEEQSGQMAWRVNLMQSERTGSARYHE